MSKQQANSQQHYSITDADLPLHCPLPNTSLWNSHPRVYLAIEESANKSAICPYCGATYTLKDS